MAEVRIGDLTWTEAEALRERDGVIGLIPLAAVEQHGYHLPLSTDSDIAAFLATAVADRIAGPVVVAPILPGGISRQHLGFAGSVSLSEELVEGYVEAYLRAFETLGIRFVAVFSAHGGNFRFLQDELPRLAERFPSLGIAGYGDFQRLADLHLAAAAREGLHAPASDIHAGALETSIVLALMPEKCRRERMDYEGYADERPEEGWIPRMQREGVEAFDRSGVLGAPRLASAEVGRAVFDAWVQDLVDWIAEEQAAMSMR
jgi:creatinine amidohydrolase